MSSRTCFGIPLAQFKYSILCLYVGVLKQVKYDLLFYINSNYFV